MEEKYIAALDVGTTTIRCHIVNSRAEFVGSASDKVELLYPKVGFVEIDPDILWNKIVNVIKNAIRVSNLVPAQVTCLGISTQRGTFITWRRSTGRHFHNFITWKDLRADKLVRLWNSSLTMKCIHSTCRFLYLITRNKRFLSGSVIKFTNVQTTLRLLWATENIPELKTAIVSGDAAFGTLDSWILHKMSGGELHISDVSNASATGLYDPFTNSWAQWALTLFRFRSEMLPKVVENTTKELGHTKQDIFGVEIPIKCSMADQCASLFGSCCFSEGDLKITLGTGSFLDIPTGSKPHGSVTGLYPVVGWHSNGELMYVAEGASNDTGSLIEWALKMGLISTPSESSVIASDIKNSDGVYFIPAFSGIGPPVNDYHAATGFLGVKPTTTKEHMVCAILESIVFRLVQLYNVLIKETDYKFTKIRVDGGVSRNDFICQLLANMTGLKVERPVNSEMSALGVAYMAGLNAGIWSSKRDLIYLRHVEHIFEPTSDNIDMYFEKYIQWCRAIHRFLNWYI